MFSMAYNYMLLFIFVSSSSQNLNNDLWSQSQGYAANKVARVMFKSFPFFKMKKKKSVLWNWRFSCKDEGINIEKENPIPKGHLLYLWKQTHSTACSLLQPFPWGGGAPHTLVLTGVPVDQDMKCWTTIKS